MSKQNSITNIESETLKWQIPNNFGYWIAISTSLITLISFGFALTAIPNSGVGCPEDCVNYPYTDIVDFYPGDYYWMFPAIILMIFYVILVSIIYQYSPNDKKLYGRIAINFALISSTIIIIDYYLQLRIIQSSLIRNETEGIPLFTQYNPNGIFIALEELGYLIMSLSFFFVALMFTGTTRLERVIRLLLIVSFLLSIISMISLFIIYGNDIDYRFEIIVISINWLTLIISGGLLAKFFKI